MDDKKLLLPAQIQAGFASEENLQLLITNALKDVELVIVDSEDKVPMANTRLGTINELIKGIEKIRKEFKDPYYKTGQEIDAYAKSLSMPLDTAKKSLNSKVMGFKKSQETKLIVEQAEIRKQSELNEKAKKAEIALIDRIREQITARLFGGQYITGEGIICPCEPAKNVAETTDIYLKLSQDFPRSFFKHMIKESETAFKELSDMVLNHQKKIAMLAAEGKLEEYIIQAKQEAQSDARVAKAKAEQGVEEQAQKDEKKMTSTMKTATKGIRATIEFSVEDIRLVPVEFLVVDQVKVNQYIKDNKEQILNAISNEGAASPVSGLRFYEHSAYIAR